MAVHLTPALEEELQHLAAQCNSTANELAQHALEDFVAFRRDLNEAVKRGDADIAAGRVLDHEKVFARIGNREAFTAAVHEGIAAGERGELVEHDEVVTMLDNIVAHG